MPPKKGGRAGGGGSKAGGGGAGGGAKAGRPKDAAWAEAQIAKLAAQRQAGPDWLAEHHSWHEGQLDYVVSCLDDGSLPGGKLPEGLRDGIEFYASQFEGQETSEEDFYVDRTIFDEALELTGAGGAAAASGGASAAGAGSETPYVREAPSAAEAGTAEELRAWPDASPQGLSSLLSRVSRHESCAEVLQAGLSRAAGLLAETASSAAAGGGGATSSSASAAAAAAVEAAPTAVLSELVPMAVAAMARFPRDSGVQKAGCGALRVAAKAPGGAGCKLVAHGGGAEAAGRALRTLLGDVEVCRAGAGLLYAMVQETSPTSPDRLIMKSAGYDALLREALAKHPTDHGLDWAVRVAMPELRG